MITQERRTGAGREGAKERELLCTADATGHLTSVNADWQRVLGWTADELTSRPLVDFVHPSDRPQIAEAITRAMKPGGEPVEIEPRFRSRGGRWRWLRMRIQNDGDSWLARASDVTDDHEAEEQLRGALSADRLVAHRQPIVESGSRARSGGVAGANARAGGSAPHPASGRLPSPGRAPRPGLARRSQDGLAGPGDGHPWPPRGGEPLRPLDPRPELHGRGRARGAVRGAVRGKPRLRDHGDRCPRSPGCCSGVRPAPQCAGRRVRARRLRHRPGLVHGPAGPPDPVPQDRCAVRSERGCLSARPGDGQRHRRARQAARNPNRCRGNRGRRDAGAHGRLRRRLRPGVLPRRPRPARGSRERQDGDLRESLHP